MRKREALRLVRTERISRRFRPVSKWEQHGYDGEGDPAYWRYLRELEESIDPGEKALERMDAEDEKELREFKAEIAEAEIEYEKKDPNFWLSKGEG